MIINGKSLDCRLGIQTQDRKMEGADESTELWWFKSIDRTISKVKRNNNNLILAVVVVKWSECLPSILKIRVRIPLKYTVIP